MTGGINFCEMFPQFSKEKHPIVNAKSMLHRTRLGLRRHLEQEGFL